MAQSCLCHLNMKERITAKNVEYQSLARSDLRFSEYRYEIYGVMANPKNSERTDLSSNESYYELSRRFGFDLARFY